MMKPQDSIIDEIRTVLNEHRSFLIAGHEDSDGDCLGSQLALFHWLKDKGKQVAVVSAGPTIDNYAFLPGFEEIRPPGPRGLDVEVTVCLDTASAERVLPGVRLEGLVINIDHHGGNTNFGALNWVDPDAAAVGEMLFTLLERDRATLTRAIAECLYIGILTDTGAFRFSKTSARTFQIAAALARAGADPHALANAYYDNVHPDTVRMTGEVLNNLRFELGGRLVWSEITRAMYERLGGVERQPEQLASQMRSIRGVEVAVLFHEMDGSGRASLRSHGRIDVSAAAHELGGGGHPSAAGCRFEGDYPNGRDRVLEVVRRHVVEIRQ